MSQNGQAIYFMQGWSWESTDDKGIKIYVT